MTTEAYPYLTLIIEQLEKGTVNPPDDVVGNVTVEIRL
jgi:hypothetical protein